VTAFLLITTSLTNWSPQRIFSPPCSDVISLGNTKVPLDLPVRSADSRRLAPPGSLAFP
jgi:hypothetical protein